MMELSSWPPLEKNDIEIENLKDLKTVKVDSTDADAAITAEHIWVVAPGALYRLNFELQAETAWHGTIDPRGLSTDEAERVYFLSFENSTVKLTALSAQGEMLWQHPIGPKDWDFRAPPMTGYDQSVFMLSAHSLLCFGPDGKPAWEQNLPEEAIRRGSGGE